MRDTTHPIRAKLQQFRRKYHLNQLVRGSLVLAVLLSSALLAAVVFEGYLWFSPPVRTTLFWSVLLLGAGVAGWGVLVPLARLWRLAPTLSDEEAARLVGRHFPDVQDKLLNYLQLETQPDAQSDLLLAALEQRIEALRPLPFTLAVNFRPSLRLARYLTVPAVLLFLFLMVQPEIVTRGSYRLFNYSTPFSPPAPYDIIIQNPKGQLIEGEPYTVEIQVQGKELPAELFLYFQGKEQGQFNQYLLEKVSATRYRYTFKSPIQDFQFYVGNELHRSDIQTVEVFERPAVTDFRIVLTYPGYTGLSPDTLPANIGDFSAIRGTRVAWQVQAKGRLKRAQLALASGDTLPSKVDGNYYRFGTQVLESQNYTIRLTSLQGIQNNDTVRYSFEAQPDRYPMVTLQAPAYEIALPSTGFVRLVALCTDDFGFTRAELKYRFVASANPAKLNQPEKRLPLTLPGSGAVRTLQQDVDFLGLGLAEGDALEYYVEVWDNDGVSGPKSATSIVQKVLYKSVNSLYEQVNDEADQLIEQLKAAVQQSQQAAQDIQDAKKKLLDKKQLQFEDKQQIQQLIENQQDILEKVQDAQAQLDKLQEISSENQLYSPELQNKLKQLEDLLKSFDQKDLDSYLEKLMGKMDNLNKTQMQQELDKLQKTNEQLERDIERSLELFKQLKVDQKVEEILQKLEDMMAKQDMLNEQLQQAKTPEQKQAIQEKQLELANDMQKLQEDIQELRDMKQDTKNPDDAAMDMADDKAQDIQEEMKNAADEMKKGNPQGADQKQKNSKKNMKQLQNMLSQMQTQAKQNEMQEDYDDLRNLLENLLTLSFDQEELRNQMKGITYNDPAVNKRIASQKKITDDMVMVRDSLVELSKRVFQIRQIVIDELDKIDLALERTFRFLDNKQLQMVTGAQHEVMTHTNNLANLLVSVLDEMQSQMSGSGMACSAPKKPGQGIQDIGKLQQQLNQQMEREMGQPGGMSPERMGELAKQQEQIRQKLKQYYDNLKKNNDGGGGLGSLDKIMDDMQETEFDFKQQQITQETLKRQQGILNRMLDYDKAMRQQEYDKQREGTTAKQQPKPSADELSPEELQQRIRRENYNRNQLPYAPAYQQLIDKYYQILDIR